MTRPFYYDIGIPLMLWPDDEGRFIVQMGVERPWLSADDGHRFAAIVTEMMPKAKPIGADKWHHRMKKLMEDAS